MALPVIFAPLAALVVALTGPVVRLVLINLGIGLITFAGVTAAVNTLIENARSSYSNLPADMMQIVSLAGFGDALGIIAAAILIRLSLQFMPRIGVLPS
jgi:hypothetical protein